METSRKKKLAVLVSGGGTNMQAIMDKIDDGQINGEIVVVISSNAKAMALLRAEKKSIPTVVAPLCDYDSRESRDEYFASVLQSYAVDYILLAGYLGIITKVLVDAYPNKIINIHPALLPAYGGESFYGLNVHKAVLAGGESVSGATVHFVDESVDTGLIILQKEVAVKQDDTPEILQERIMNNAEYVIFPQVVKDICDDKICVKDNKVIYKK